MKKKLGNDVEFQITVTRLGIAEDFANATDILVKVYQHNGNCGYIMASSERTNNVFDVYLLADNLSLGTYDCDISYKLPDTNSPTGTRSCSGSYRSVFTVVKNTEDEDDEGQGIVINVGYVKDRAYVYIASASDTLGSNFSYPADLTQDYIAILGTTIAKTPEASDFAGLWFSKIDAYRAAVIGGYTGTEEEFFAEEQNRVDAEVIRESNEDTRKENELTRISSENTRGDNEDNRTSAEVIRSSNEVNRINAELLRNSNESTRGINEGIRQDNEVTRIANENIRIANEGDETSGRVKAELDRVAAEAVREVIKDSMIELNENPPKLFEVDDRLVWHYWDLSTHAYVSSGLSEALNWRGVYVTGSTYMPLDVVSYNESTWLCITESTGNLPTTAYFVPLAKGSYQYWLEAGNTGTYEDYLAWLDSKEDIINKKQTVTNSETDYPSGKAVYDELAALRHDQLRDPNGDPNYQHVTKGAQTFTGVKTFSSSPLIPTPTADTQAAPKKYVDDADALKVDKVVGERLINAAEIVKLTNTSNTNTGDETQATIKNKLESATAARDGYLTKEDFSTFNGKQAALGYTPENVANKKSTITNSETDYPSGKAVYDELAALRHDQLRDPNGDPNYLHVTTGAQTFAGVKTFSSSPIIPIPETDYQGAPRKYVNDQDALRVANTTLETTEEVTAETLVILKNRIDALQKIISDMILGTVQIDSLSIVKTFNLYGSSNLILTGTAAPAVEPDFIGQFFIKTSATTACYQATGNSSVNDWKQIG